MSEERRADGWPLCPHCGEDELWSAFQWNGDGERPPLQAWIDAGLTCYCCGWSSIDPVAEVASQLAVMVLQRRLAAGNPIEIPPLGITISPVSE